MEHAGHEPGHRVYEHHGGQLPACKYIVAYGDLIRHDLLYHALIHSLIVPAEHHQPRLAGQLLGQPLGEGAPLGGHIYGAGETSAGIIARGGRGCALTAVCGLWWHIHRGSRCGHGLTDSAVAVIYGLRLHEHTGAAAVGVVVHHALTVGGVVTYLPGGEGDGTTSKGATQDAGPKPRLDDLRE